MFLQGTLFGDDDGDDDDTALAGVLHVSLLGIPQSMQCCCCLSR